MLWLQNLLLPFNHFSFSKWRMASSNYILWCSCIISYGWFSNSVKNPRLYPREKKKSYIGVCKFQLLRFLPVAIVSVKNWETWMTIFNGNTNDHQKPLSSTNIISPFSVGNAGNSLTYHSGMQFTTKDQDNDQWGSNCAQTYQGAWWYKVCHKSNLNGRYLHGSHRSAANGMNWYTWKDYYYSAARSEMKIRPVSF